ncbi:MAG TPA: glycosyltransferase [Acidimicrobiales bacterium]|nr:glycosyltransferase [Acidimicrobiales bacterium]
MGGAHRRPEGGARAGGPRPGLLRLHDPRVGARPADPPVGSAGLARRPGVTVVVPSWRRPDGLRDALSGLARQADPGVDWDVVVVASASDPGVAGVVAGVDLPAPVTVVDEPLPGASRARNRGLAASRKVVAFLDDDCRPSATWLASITAPVLAGRAGGTGGPVVADPAVGRPRWLGEALLAYLAAYDRGDVDRELAADDFVLTANAAFDADLVESVGGFDPALGPTAGRPTVDDDVDLCRRVAAVGGSLAYVAGAVVVHDLPAGRLTPTYMVRRVYAQGRSDWLLDRDELRGEPGRGAGLALPRLRGELAAILPQGPWKPAVALHAACSAARAAGFIREAVGAGRRPPG